MGFYIRKSVKFGPIRFNISKSGIGISSGIPGARVSTGPRGTYIHMGRNGIYYRKKIDESIPTTNQTRSQGYEQKTVNNSEIPTASVNELIDSSNSELITQINTRIQQPTFAVRIGLIFTIIATLLACSAFTILPNFIIAEFLLLLIAITIGVTGLYLAWGTNEQEKVARITTLQYNFDEDTKSAFLDLQKAFKELSKSVRIWRVTSRESTWDWKRNAGASSLITRERIAVRISNPPFLQTQFKVYCFSLGSMELFFLPDQLFVFENGRYGAVSYDMLEVDTYPTWYREGYGPPNDSRILEYTWQYVRKDGGPDGRFSNNRQIPIVEYGQIEFSSPTGMNLHFQISNLELAQQFGHVLSHYVDFHKSSHRNPSSKSSPNSQERQSKQKPIWNLQESNAHSVLNVSSDASKDEITSAYKKLAQQYHPDKVEGLGSEFKELAEKRMKDINAAYKELMGKFKD
ncbi:MAG: DUF4236 domain-containing protein [Anaerolineales bacterium]|nr:DUF4236 domain-containing protein [Anaerolineales bacterium]